MTDMSSQLFGTDGIRGPAGEYPLDAAGMLQIGKAVGAYFTEPGDEVLVGWDPRESSEGLVASVVEGLTVMGVHIRRLGVLPTPGLAYLTRRLKSRAGVMITASHNPYTDNGVKVFTPDGRKLSDKDQAGLNELIDTRIATRGTGDAVEDAEVVKLYEEFLVGAAEGVPLDGLKLAVDSANGAASGLAARVFRRLGAEVTALFDRPDGRNINVGCGATNTSALQNEVRKHRLDAGAAFDGDADRLMLVDGLGRQLTGDHIMYILAASGGYKGVAATIMSNQGLKTALAGHNIELVRTPVGDRSVLQRMDRTGFRLGGEQSGHVILSDYSATGDGLLAAVRTLTAVLKSGKKLAAWHDELKLLPQALLSIPFPDKSLLESEDVKRFIDSQAAQLGAAGRLNVRASGTEPKVRIMVEAPDADKRAREIADKLTRLAGIKEQV
jgi:phosphoglucosamine mutase